MKSWRNRTSIATGAVALAFTFALTFSSAARAGMDEITCQQNDELAPEYGPVKKANDFCPQANPQDQRCHTMLDSIERISTAIRSGLERKCRDMDEAQKRSAQAGTQTNSLQQNLNIYSELLGVFKKYDEALSIAGQDIKGKLPPVLEPHPSPAANADTTRINGEVRDLRNALKTRDALDKFDVKRVPETKTIESAHGSKNHFAARNGFRFLKHLMAEQKRNTEAMGKLNSTITGMRSDIEKMNKPPGQQQPPPQTTTPQTASTGLNPNTLMGLATAGMGLANMMKQQQAAQDAAAPTATSPTPGSGNPAEKPPVNVSKLEDGKSKGGPAVATTTSPPEEEKSGPAPAGFAGGSAYNDDSDISAPAETKGAGPAASKGPGGGGGGGGDAGGGSERALSGATTPETHKEDEALQGIGGGGLGGGPGGMSSGSSMPPSDPAVAAAEEGMKDLLNDMKDTVEGNPDGLGLDGETVASDGGIMEMDAEDLFPRVRAAHVRSLKQGRVLNGLGEKITPDSE